MHHHRPMANDRSPFSAQFRYGESLGLCTNRGIQRFVADRRYWNHTRRVRYLLTPRDLTQRCNIRAFYRSMGCRVVGNLLSYVCLLLCRWRENTPCIYCREYRNDGMWMSSYRYGKRKNLFLHGKSQEWQIHFCWIERGTSVCPHSYYASARISRSDRYNRYRIYCSMVSCWACNGICRAPLFETYSPIRWRIHAGARGFRNDHGGNIWMARLLLWLWP